MKRTILLATIAIAAFSVPTAAQSYGSYRDTGGGVVSTEPWCYEATQMAGADICIERLLAGFYAPEPQIFPVATSSANVTGGKNGWASNYWNGSASALDYWSVQDVLGSGTNPTSTLKLTHAGSSGTAVLQAPMIPAASKACGSSSSCASPTAIVSPLIYTTGTIAFAAGTSATVTGFPNAYTSATSFGCTAFDASNPAYTWMVVPASTTSITITAGTLNSDTWAYFCWGT